MERPAFIPEYATNVRNIGYLWLWEFSGGSTVVLGTANADGNLHASITLQHELLEELLADFRGNDDRYKVAIQREKERQASYMDYLDSLEGDEDEEAYCCE